MDDIFQENGVVFSHPFLPYDETERLTHRLYREFTDLDIKLREIIIAVLAARREDKRFKDDIKIQGAEALRLIEERGLKAAILAGRPYHLDPEVNHGIASLINTFDMAVLTEDSVANLARMGRPVRVLDQWMYHSRLYRAAEVAGSSDNLELVQLNSFGCGLDAVTTDQVEEILAYKNKLYTVLKIDEGSNLGAAKIRIRSLKAAMEGREKKQTKTRDVRYAFKRVMFSEQMRKDYTILIPQMSPVHFQFVEPALKYCGYNTVLLPPVDVHAVDEGLKYINNDVCFPTIVALGQVISYLKSGACDVN
jgi:predicted nucleotide-binding protein (sugar kinase/HSP70/actin superfamily)